jgi:ankyrin repeat protein
MKNICIKLIAILLLTGVGLVAMDKPLPEKSKGIFASIKDAISSKPATEKATEKLRALIDGDKSKVTLKNIEPLIVSGADKEVTSAQGKTILMRAVYENNTPLVTFLLQSKANPRTGALVVQAASNSNVEMIKELIKAGAPVNAVDESNLSALYKSVLSRDLEITRVLLSSGANINIQTGRGNTPLHAILLEKGNYNFDRRYKNSKNEIIDYLIANGADTHIVNESKVTPAMLLTDINYIDKPIAQPKLDETSLKLLEEIQNKNRGKK